LGHYAISSRHNWNFEQCGSESPSTYSAPNFVSSGIIDTWLASENLAWDWLFTHNDEIKRQVLSLLQVAGFDESAIEAEAYRLVADDLAKADRMLKAAQDRRDKNLRMIAKLRKSLAQQLRRNSDRVLAADKVPSIASDAEV
jgi:hypothetical protein